MLKLQFIGAPYLSEIEKIFNFNIEDKENVAMNFQI